MYALELNREDDASLSGEISSLTADVPFTAVDNPRKEKPEHPDFLIYARSPRGKAIAIGAIWNKIGRDSDKPYLFVTFRINGKAVAASAFETDDSNKLNVIFQDND